MRAIQLLLVSFLSLIAGHFNGAMAEDADIGRKSRMQGELLGAFEAAIAAADSIAPYEVVGRSVRTELFGAEVREVDEINFRLKFNLEDELVVWAFEQRTNAGLEDGDKALPFGKLSIMAKVIDHRRVFTCSGGRVSSSERQSFDDALESAVVPHVRYWGILGFPHWDSPSKELAALKAKVGGEGSTITSTVGDSFVRYTLREDRAPGQFDLWHWDFDLKSHFIVRRHLERAAQDNRKVTYQLEEHSLETIGDTTRPLLLDRSDTIVQNFSNRKVGRLGTMSTVTELGWIRVAESAERVDAESLTLSSPGDILNYINEGKRLVVNIADAD